MLRGRRNCADVEKYRAYLGKLFEQLNAGRKPRLSEEMKRIQLLPERRPESVKRVRARVNSGSLIVVERNSYSINSQLIVSRFHVAAFLAQGAAIPRSEYPRPDFARAERHMLSGPWSAAHDDTDRG